MPDFGHYYDLFKQYYLPLGIPLIVIGFIIILASVFLDNGREDLIGAFILILGGLAYRFNSLPSISR